MKKIQNFILLLFFLSISIAVIISCSNSEINLVCNESFESNHQPDLSCWKLVMDTHTYSDWYSTEVPPNCGNFSLKLVGSEDASFEPYAETYITQLSGKYHLQISAYIKSLYGDQSIHLSATKKRNNAIIQTAEYRDGAFNEWKNFKIVQEFQMDSTDTLFIRITQSSGQNSACLIDMVTVRNF
jgi:hypothetical protein